ncbi:hypothetical protein Tco_0544156 [Tanacetum coccineum]
MLLWCGVRVKDANHKFLRSLPPAWDSLAMTMRTKKNIDTLSIDDLYNNLSVFEQDIQKTSSSSQQLRMGVLSQPKPLNKHKLTTSSGRKVECFIATNWAFCEECKYKGFKGRWQFAEAGRGRNFKPGRNGKEALMTIDEDSYNALQAKYDELQSEFGDQEAALVAHKLAVKKLESQLKASHKQQSSLNEKLNFQANQIFEKDEKLKKYRRILNESVKEKRCLQKL